MDKLRKLLAALTSSHDRQEALRERANRRMKARHKGQKRAEGQAAAAREAGDRLRAAGHTARADRKGRKARRLDVKAEREKTRAVFWRGRVRVLAKRIEGIDDDLDKIKTQIAQSGAHVEGNHVKGGDEFERWLLCLNTAAANCAEQKRRNFYSMGGTWNVDHPLVGGEKPGERSDCSQTQTAFIKSCAFPDINGEDFNGGFTGTMLRASDRWVEVSLSHMLSARRPAVIVYGSGNGHHTEGWCPSIAADGSFIDPLRTVGHGSDPVDEGTVHLFGAGEVERYFILAAQ